MVMAMIGKEKYQCITEENNMLLTESQLRNTIRKILLENQSHESKLTEMIASGDHDNIIQALDLADTIGLIEITHQEEHERHWRGSYNCKFNILSETFANKLKEIAFSISKGYYLTHGSNIQLDVDVESLEGEVWIRRDDHYSLQP